MSPASPQSTTRNRTTVVNFSLAKIESYRLLNLPSAVYRSVIGSNKFIRTWHTQLHTILLFIVHDFIPLIVFVYGRLHVNLQYVYRVCFSKLTTIKTRAKKWPVSSFVVCTYVLLLVLLKFPRTLRFREMHRSKLPQQIG